MCFRAFAVMFIAPFFSIIQNVFLSGKSGIGANHTDGLRGWKVAGDTAYWTRENVKRIISDERYTGCLIGRKRTRVDVSKPQTAKVPKEEWIVARDTHEAIVSKEIYGQAQKVLKRNVKKKKPVRD